MERNGNETWQSSLLYVSVAYFGARLFLPDPRFFDRPH